MGRVGSLIRVVFQVLFPIIVVAGVARFSVANNQYASDVRAHEARLLEAREMYARDCTLVSNVTPKRAALCIDADAVLRGPTPVEYANMLYAQQFQLCSTPETCEAITGTLQSLLQTLRWTVAFGALLWIYNWWSFGMARHNADAARYSLACSVADGGGGGGGAVCRPLHVVHGQSPTGAVAGAALIAVGGSEYDSVIKVKDS